LAWLKFGQAAAAALPFPGFNTATKTYAAWPVWRGSTTAQFKWPEVKKKVVLDWYNLLKRSPALRALAGRYGSKFGNALRVYECLWAGFQNWRTGRLDPSYEAIADRLQLGRTSVANALRLLRELGVIFWQRRCDHDRNPDTGRFELRQKTNAYVLLPPTQWRFDAAAAAQAPPPKPGTWGDHPPLPDMLAQAADELAHGQRQTAIAVLASDPSDKLAGALASLGRTMTSPVPASPEIDRTKLNDDELFEIAWKEAMRTLPQERGNAFLRAMLENDPPQWALDERARLVDQALGRRQ
jgi:hypothetical protein